MTSILLVAVTIRMTQDEPPILLPGTDPEAGCMHGLSVKSNHFPYNYSSIINDAAYSPGTQFNYMNFTLI